MHVSDGSRSEGTWEGVGVGGGGEGASNLRVFLVFV